MQQEKAAHATFSNSPNTLFARGISAQYSLVSNRAMEGTRSDVLACWGTGRVRSAGSRRDIDLQCLLRSIATPITTEPSARLPLPFSLICLSCSFPLCVSSPLVSRSLVYFLAVLCHTRQQLPIPSPLYCLFSLFVFLLLFQARFFHLLLTCSQA